MASYDVISDEGVEGGTPADMTATEILSRRNKAIADLMAGAVSPPICTPGAVLSTPVFTAIPRSGAGTYYFSEVFLTTLSEYMQKLDISEAKMIKMLKETLNEYTP